jgi:hypothetical protein
VLSSSWLLLFIESLSLNSFSPLFISVASLSISEREVVDLSFKSLINLLLFFSASFIIPLASFLAFCIISFLSFLILSNFYSYSFFSFSASRLLS